MKGRKPTTSRIEFFYRTLFGKKRKERLIAWLTLAVLFLLCNDYFDFNLVDWIFENSAPLGTALTFTGVVEILREMFRRGRRKKNKSKRKH
ncbi:MAG: hypothetical protein NTW29_18450 [Bacteroidetes bacterium]|nr:hypothetical protein [Bacteroidota bacterium]